MRKKSNWNIANLLTISRIVVAPIFLVLIFRDELWCKWTAGVLFGLGAYSDYLDGYLARKYHLYSDLGALLDPLADKVLLLSAFLAFVQMQLAPAWMVLTIMAREFLITGLRQVALSRQVVIAASRAGKHKTVSQIVAISVILAILCVRATLDQAPGGWETLMVRAGSWGEWIEHFVWGGPYWLVFYATVMSVLSGVDYVARNYHVLSGSGRTAKGE
jgi:CDP-diacylglycerol--glycerol-3-phosphate 3-phosphatidyltransferase